MSLICVLGALMLLAMGALIGCYVDRAMQVIEDEKRHQKLIEAKRRKEKILDAVAEEFNLERKGQINVKFNKKTREWEYRA